MTDPKKKAMADVIAATRATAAMAPAGMPPTKRALRREKSKSRMGAEAHDPAVTHLMLEKTHDYHEAAHDGCITEPPKLQTVSFEVGGLDGVRAKSGSGIGDSLSRLAQEGMAKLAPITGAGSGVPEQEQQVEVEIYIRCQDILATRGTKTDSFVRVILIDEALFEHEVGRTEVQDDTLNPEYRHPVQLKFRLDDQKHRLRFELCDPGETKVRWPNPWSNPWSEPWSHPIPAPFGPSCALCAVLSPPLPLASPHGRKQGQPPPHPRTPHTPLSALPIPCANPASNPEQDPSSNSTTVLGAVLLTLQELVKMVGIGGDASSRRGSAEIKAAQAEI